MKKASQTGQPGEYIDSLGCVLKAAKSVFRYEALQDYSAMDGEEFVQEYLKLGTFSPLPKDTEWWQEIKNKNDQGIRTCRVRLVSYPLTDYTKAELAWHKEAAAFSGEDIRTIEKEALERIFNGREIADFYLVDGMHLYFLEYGAKGKLIRDILINDEKEIARYAEYAKKMTEASSPI